MNVTSSRGSYDQAIGVTDFGSDNFVSEKVGPDRRRCSKMVALNLLLLVAFSVSLHPSSGLRVERDGAEITVPFLEYAIDELRSRIPNGVDILDEHLGSLGSEETQRKWKGFLETLDDGGATCTLCRAAIRSLAELSQEIEWEEIRDPVVNACKVLLLGIDEDTDVDEICTGIIDLQGPHVYNVVASLNTGANSSKPNIRSCCENLNMCFPPKEAKKARQDLTNDDKPLPAKTRERTKADFREKWAKLKAHLEPGRPHNKQRQRRSTQRNVMTVVQLTDVHMDPLYAEGAPTDCNLYICCREKYEGEGSAHRYGDHNCNTPQSTVNLFLEEVAKINPDFIIYSGDTPPHSQWEETFESQLACTEILLQSINKTLSDFDVYTNIGNHEMYPTNLYYVPMQDTVDMSAKFAELWQPFCKFEQEQIDTMKHAGYYSMLVRPGLRIISFNTLYWYSFNWYTTLNELEQDGEDMYAYLEQELQNARDNNEKVIVVGHHPPGNGDIIVSHTRRFVDAVVEYSDVIVLHISGHTHRDDYRVVADADGVAKEVVFIAPAITPRGRINPSARVYEMDSDTFELLDYRQYHMNLESVIGGAEVELQLTYDAREVYGLEDLSPASWQDLAYRFEDDDDLFQVFNQNYNTQTGGGECHGTCKKGRICSLLNPNYDEYQECRSPSLGGTAEPPSATTGV